MLGINSNINSLIAQQNLNASGSALSQAITRLSSGKRINSAADDAAGLAISNRMQTQINGLNQGVSNANDGVSMIQTASSGLAQITTSLQTIRTLAVQASSGSLSASDQAALQQEVAQQIAEVNRVASQTTYNGKNVLDGSAGSVSFQIGANVGQTIGLNLSQGVSAASLGQGLASAGSTLGTLNNLSLNASGVAVTSGATLTSVNVLSDGKGGFTYTDQNNQALSSTAVTNLFGNSTGVGGALNITAPGTSSLLATNQLSTISTANASPPAGTGTTIGTVSGISISATTGLDVAAGTQGAITSITVKTNGTGGMNFYDQNGTQLSTNLTGTTTTAGSLLDLTATNGAGGVGGVAFTSPKTQAAAITAISGAQNALPASTTTLGTISGLSISSTTGLAVPAGTQGAITSLTVQEGTTGALTFLDQNGNALSSGAAGTLVGTAALPGTLITLTALGAAPGLGTAKGQGFSFTNAALASAGPQVAAFSGIDSNNQPGTVANVNVSTTAGANAAMESIDNALATVNNIQATLGAAQNRFTSLSSAQQAQSTDLAGAQSQITDANFAQETANLSKANVMQQAGISVLAQANSNPQQVLKLLQ